ncbi:MAG: radical SAM protein [Opitutaceae bacterium]
MNCEILHTLYVRSNGDVPCNDDAGENVLVGIIRPQLDRWSATALLTNHRYRHIRDALREERKPWPAVCDRCAFFRPNEPLADPLREKRLRKLQVEPSLACRLRCPGCANFADARVRLPRRHMDLGMFERILRSLREERYAIGEFEYCGQGEPLMHPNFPALVDLAREYFPASPQRLITSGNFDFHTETAGRRIDEIMVSCDGVGQENYARQRVRGDVTQALRFLRDAAATAIGAGTRVVWKYILFEWNDSEAEIAAAEHLAAEFGVSELLFVYTHSAGKSRRYTLENHGDFPARSSLVVTNPTPIHYQNPPQPVPSLTNLGAQPEAGDEKPRAA